MKKKTRYIIQFVCLAAVFLAIMMQSFTQWVEMKPLNGFDNNEEQPISLSFKTYYDGSYQNYLTEHAKRNTGFREFLIRNYNQVAYSLFDKITNDNVLKGSNNELYLKMYLNEITGKQLQQDYDNIEAAQAEARMNVEETLRLIDTLHSHGTEFLFVFAPSKTWVYPEYMPKYYQEHISEFCLEEYYIELFKENGIPHIDFHNYFREIKDTVPYPLYSRFGTHWAQSTMPFVMDSILKKISAVTGKNLPGIQCVETNLTNDYTILDDELEGQINLLFPLSKPELPRPILALTDTLGADKPNLLLVGDSYGNQLVFSPFAKAFNHWDYWVYNRDICSSRPHYNGKHLDVVFDADKVLEEADIVLAVFTAPMLYTYMFDFAHTAQKMFQGDTVDDEKAIQAIIDNIKNDPAWYQAIKQQAEKLGISVEENLRFNAEYTFRNLHQPENQP